MQAAPCHDVGFAPEYFGGGFLHIHQAIAQISGLSDYHRNSSQAAVIRRAGTQITAIFAAADKRPAHGSAANMPQAVAWPIACNAASISGR
jgi:hypothetical protein